MGLRFGRYETLREIAAGGMATVYLARAVGEGGFERLVAVKVMHPHLARDEEFVTMFLDEARLAAGIHHPNVVGTLDVQKSAEGTFLVMDFIDGASLQEVQRYHKRNHELMPLGIVLRVILDALTGLHAAHELANSTGELLYLVHRDVSPQNILVGKDGVARLTDFGVARASARLSSTRGGQLKGKLAYMPPEQILAEPVDRRSDVYSAGVVLWEALVGKRLFRAQSDGELVHKIIDGATQSPTEKNDRVPEPISRACMRALSVSRGDRYPSAAAFADEIEDAARQAGVPVASSRAVATFMKAILPAIDLGRTAEAPLTPPSGASRPASLDSSEGDRSASASASVPSVVHGSSPDSPTRTEAVLPKTSGSRLGSRATWVVLAAVAAGAGVGAVTMLWPGERTAGVVADPAGTADTSEPSGVLAPPTASSDSSGSASSTAPSSPPSASVAAVPSGEPTAAPSASEAPAARPARPARPPTKSSLTDYDPDEL